MSKYEFMVLVALALFNIMAQARIDLLQKQVDELEIAIKKLRS